MTDHRFDLLANISKLMYPHFTEKHRQDRAKKITVLRDKIAHTYSISINPIISNLDCSQPLYLRTRKKRGEHQARGGRGRALGAKRPGKTRPHPLPSQVFRLRWSPVLSRFPPCVQRSNKNTRKKRALNNLF